MIWRRWKKSDGKREWFEWEEDKNNEDKISGYRPQERMKKRKKSDYEVIQRDHCSNYHI